MQSVGSEYVHTLHTLHTYNGSGYERIVGTYLDFGIYQSIIHIFFLGNVWVLYLRYVVTRQDMYSTTVVGAL